MSTTLTVTAYQEAFDRECGQTYPAVDAFETRAGFKIDTGKLREAAFILACPLKVNPPNWQHGRVIYAAAREHFEGYRGRAMVLDIGTAKGFSALCLLWAMRDARVQGNVVSVDVLDPCSRDRRNTVAELDQPRTLFELLRPWPESSNITFQQSTGIDYLKAYAGRIDVAFVDGKHTGAVVACEAQMLADRQQRGDLVVFDDVHLKDVRDAVSNQRGYLIEWLSILPNRAYAIGRRR
jgi:predicted O-methyltransferase YrrM